MRESTTTSTPARPDLGLKLYGYKEVGAILGVSDRTVFSLVKSRTLRAVRFGRSVRISSTVITEFIARHEGDDHAK